MGGVWLSGTIPRLTDLENETFLLEPWASRDRPIEAHRRESPAAATTHSGSLPPRRPAYFSMPGFHTFQTLPTRSGPGLRVG